MPRMPCIDVWSSTCLINARNPAQGRCAPNTAEILSGSIIWVPARQYHRTGSDVGSIVPVKETEVWER
jgi:hypothetical protein